MLESGVSFTFGSPNGEHELGDADVCIEKYVRSNGEVGYRESADGE